MQVSVENLSKVEKRLTISVPSQRLEQAFNVELARFAQKVDIKGFRRGKVPLAYVKERFGQEVRSEALNTVIQETFYEAVQQEKIQPLNQPRVEPKTANSDAYFEYVATFEVLPEPSPVEFKADKFEKLVAVIGEKEIDQTLERMREQNRTWLTVERKARENDKVKVQLTLTGEDEKPLTAAPLALDFILHDSPSLFGWNVLETLAGLEAGSEKKFKHELPAESTLQSLGGQHLNFDLSVVAVEEPELPALDQAFVQRLGIKSGELSDLRAEIKKQLEFNLKRLMGNQVREKVFALLVEQNALEIPNSLIQREAKHLHDDSCEGGAHGAHQHKPEEEAYFLDVAKKRIHLGILAGEFATQHKLTASQARVDELIAEYASAYADTETTIQNLKADSAKRKELEAQALEEQIVEKLLEKVSIVEKEVSYEELLKNSR